MRDDDNIRALLAARPVLRRLAPTLALLASIALALPLPVGAAPPSGFSGRADVRAFVDELVREHGFTHNALRRLFAQARPQASVVAAMQRPLVEPPKWYVYARPFLSPERVRGGVQWWNAHADDLARAEERYGVPAEIVVAILGVETFYGRNIGRYRALDALATLAFDYPRRAAFFQGELREFLLLSRELSISPLVPKGSFAGALGVPQFMPGSYRAFAVDFDGSGRVDLWTSAADIVGSVAHFLIEHGWQPGQPALLKARIADEHRDAVLQRLDGGISERQSLEFWAAMGVTPLDAPSELDAQPVGLLSLEEGEDAAGAPEHSSYWIACQNFYVLTRYNRSRLYAAAVWELAMAIRQSRIDSSRP